MKQFSTINEERFLSQVSHFFRRPEGVVLEIAQNALRAGATNLDITVSETSFMAVDNGRGAGSIEPLFRLADSAWSEEVEIEQMPAGWGLFYLMAVSEKVAYQSTFGYVEVDCERFLKQSNYRNGLFGLINPRNKREGFKVRATVLPDVAEKLAQTGDSLRYFPLDINFNGKRVKKETLESKVGYERVEYRPGCTVYIKPQENMFDCGNPAYTLEKMGVVFHGLPINMGQFYNNGIYVDITEGMPLTPVLPYRSAIKLDKKAEELVEFIRQYVATSAREMIEAVDIRKARENLGWRCSSYFPDYKDYLAIAENAMTAEEMDSLNIWSVKRIDHNNNKYEPTNYKRQLIEKGEVPKNERAVLMINGKIKEDDDGTFVIGEGMVAGTHLAGRSPRWVVIDTEEVMVDVKCTEPPKDYAGSGALNYTWQKADSITVGGKPQKTICTIAGHDLKTVYYQDSPTDFHEIDDIVFSQHLLAEDGDSWEVQKDAFDCNVSADIQNITGTFVKADLYKGFWTAGISPYQIQAIITGGDDTIKVTLKDGTERILSLAA